MVALARIMITPSFGLKRRGGGFAWVRWYLFFGVICALASLDTRPVSISFYSDGERTAKAKEREETSFSRKSRFLQITRFYVEKITGENIVVQSDYSDKI